jgi:phosphatidate cytidylyltransferase
LLRFRLLSAAALIGIVAATVWLDLTYNFGRSGIWMVPFGVAFLALAVEEFRGLVAPLATLSRFVLHAGTQAILLPTFVPAFYQPYPETCSIGRLGFPLVGLAAATLFAFVAEMRRFEGPGKSTLRVALAAFCFAILGVPFAFFVLLRLFHENAWGMTALVSLILVVKAADSGAYFTGRFFGRTKMAPVLSPKKTWEGAAGGLVAGALSSWAFFAIVAPLLLTESQIGGGELWWLRCLAYGVALAIAGLIGDLAESLVKRDLGAKDSGRGLPGMGGVWDVIDSTLGAAPVAYLCWALGLIGPLVD